ncbi:hypothetical protein [Dysgonomonas gadei]|uniref:hypothetical protein n=1 Tax=Dysgonomonas gadei TaxID=156974 RepID=UPI003AF0A0BE
MNKDNNKMTDVTDEIFGTKNDASNKAVSKESKKADMVGEQLPEGFEFINPPAEQLPQNIIPAEILDRQKELDNLFRDVTKNFIRIGFHLLHFKETREYKPLGYSRFDDFVKKEYGLSKSTAYNFINVCVKYSAKDNDGKPTRILAKEYQKYTSSQLIAMLRMNEDAIAQIDPDKTAREIKKELKVSKNYDGEFNPESDNYSDAEKAEEGKEEKSKKKNSRDITIPVMRLSMAKGQTWDDVMTDKVRNACNIYLNDDKRVSDGNDYSIEICIVYPDKSAI